MRVDASFRCDTLEREVPQGSILGPVLFSVYINDLPVSLGEANTDMYADDTTLWSSSKSCNEIQQTSQNALNIIEQWFAVNCIWYQIMLKQKNY